MVDQISEKDLMTDLMQTQRFITSSYNGKASEATSPALKEQILRVLGDEQLCLSLIGQAMEQRGWSQSQPAKQQDIQNAISKFNDPQVFIAMEQMLQTQYQIPKEATTMYRQTYLNQGLNDFRQSSGDYGFGQFGYAGGGISGMQGMGTSAQGYGTTGVGAQGLYGQSGGYQGMGMTGAGYQGGGWGVQPSMGYQGAGWGQQMGMGGLGAGGMMNTAAQGLQSSFPGLFSSVMNDWTQTRPDVYGYQGQGGFASPMQNQFRGQYQQAGFQGQQPQFGYMGQYPQTGFQGQNVLNNFQQTRGYGGGAGFGVGNMGGYGTGGYSGGGYATGGYGGGGYGAGGYGAGGGFGQGYGGTTMGTYGGGIMNAAANTLQSNIGNLRGNVLNDWTLTSPENQDEFLAQQRQFGTMQSGAIPRGLQTQISQTQPFNQQSAAGLYGTSGFGATTGLGAATGLAGNAPWAGSGLAGTTGYTGGYQSR